MPKAKNIPDEIAQSGLTIYSSLQDQPGLFIPTDTLEAILNQKLKGLVLNQPIRTRSKVLKMAVCTALGYPVPKSFAKTQPRFPGQNFDTYVQKSNNLQIWNEEVSSSRRYVLIRVNDNDVVTKVRVATGEVLAAYDRTGTLTHKYQAKLKTPATASILVARSDTKPVVAKLLTPKQPPNPTFRTIGKLFEELRKLEGTVIHNPGSTQERNRGGSLHEAIARKLGQLVWKDNG